MQKTANLGLNMPEDNEWADQDAINENTEAIDAAIATHTNNKSNPHEVTAKQVGAPTKEEFAQLSNPNLLPNADFKINQRGQTEYTGGGVFYTVDRWCSSNANLTVNVLEENNGSYLRLTNNGAAVSTGYAYFRQYLENGMLGDFTISVDVRGSGTFNLNISGEDKDNTANCLTLTLDNETEWTRHSVTFNAMDKLGEALGQVYFKIYQDAVIEIKNVKLELGSIATPFVPPDPATELMKCQRYFESIGVNYNIDCFSKTLGVVDKYSTFVIQHMFAVNKRVTPTIILPSDLTNALEITNIAGVTPNVIEAYPSRQNVRFIGNISNLGNDYANTTCSLMCSVFADAEIY